MTDDPPQTECSEALNRALHLFIEQILAAGEPPDGLADALVAHGLAIRVQLHDRQEIARNLFALSLRFADPRLPVPGESGATLQ